MSASPAMRTTAALCAIGIVTLTFIGCGANVVFDGNDDGGGELDCEDVAFDFDVVARVCGENESCSIIGELPDGREARILCGGDPPGCTLSVENTQVCSCPDDRIDWANACPNGVPTCAGWRIDYADALFTCQEAP
jgi:hypothetical protein